MSRQFATSVSMRAIAARRSRRSCGTPVPTMESDSDVTCEAVIDMPPRRAPNPPRRREGLFEERGDDCACLDARILQICDRDADRRMSVEHVGGAVDRIDDPEWGLEVECLIVTGALLGEDLVVRERLAQRVRNHPIRRDIRFGRHAGVRGCARGADAPPQRTNLVSGGLADRHSKQLYLSQITHWRHASRRWTAWRALVAQVPWRVRQPLPPTPSSRKAPGTWCHLRGGGASRPTPDR